MDDKHSAVYILANKPSGVLYTGVTSALWSRVATHKDGGVKGFTWKYNVKILVWFEHHHFMERAIRREKQIKEWKRQWKIEMIEKMNPDWCDLHNEIDPDRTLVSLPAQKGPDFRRDDDSEL